MSGEAFWAELRPILQDMTDRIGRIEQFLASSGFQAPGSGFDAVPASFGPPPVFGSQQPVSGFGGPQPGTVPEDILWLVRSGKKIQAIKELRERTGISLKEAKDIIDQAARGY